MHKVFLSILIVTCWILPTSSQVNFEKGYYINNQNERIECLIKNNASRNSPTNFWYKSSESGDEIKMFIRDVREFEIYNKLKFLRVSTNIDQSSQSVNKLDKNWEPIFENKTVFVKSIIEGDGSLYSYVNGNRELFFFSIGSSDIKQLIYKRYLKERKNLRENNTFRKQLLENLLCPDFNFEKIQLVDYSKKSLKKIFNEYNICKGHESTITDKQLGKTKFNLALRPRWNSSDTTTPNPVFESADLTMDKKQGFGLGIETEIILPINRNKWSIIAEAAYQEYNSQKSYETNNISGGITNVKITYSSIEVPLGVRYYIFLNKDIKLFLNTAYIFDFTLDNEIEFKRNDGTLIREFRFKTNGSLSGGIGLNYLNKFSLELRNSTISNRAINYSDSHFNSISIIFGYNFL